jgi:hypothetical protein
MRVILPVIVCLSVCYCLQAQNRLLFTKNWYRSATYLPGDVITFRLNGDREKVKMRIIAIEDTVVVFRNYRINPKDITHLYVDSKTKIWYVLRFKWEKLLFLGGIAFLAADVVNTGELSPTTAMISGSMIAGGFLVHWLIPRKIKISGKSRLDIIHG